MQIASYAFTFPDEAATPRRMLLPLLDLINHGDPERVNLDIIQADNGDFFAYTLRDIRKGEEVRIKCTACTRPAQLQAVHAHGKHLQPFMQWRPNMLTWVSASACCRHWRLCH